MLLSPPFGGKPPQPKLPHSLREFSIKPLQQLYFQVIYSLYGDCVVAVAKQAVNL